MGLSLFYWNRIGPGISRWLMRRWYRHPASPSELMDLERSNFQVQKSFKFPTNMLSESLAILVFLAAG